MGYYENPPIIPLVAPSGIAQGITQAGQAVTQSLLRKAERLREEQKEEKLTIQKLQEQRNRVDLAYNKSLSEWDKTRPKTDDNIDSQLYSIVDEQVKAAADAQMALLNETDLSKRKEYLTQIRNTDALLDQLGTFTGNIASTAKTWQEQTSAKYGTPGGYYQNGEGEEMEINAAILDVLSGKNQLYKNTKSQLKYDKNSNSIILNISGEMPDGRKFNRDINSNEYNTADGAGLGLIAEVPNIEDMYSAASKSVVGENGKIKETFLGKVATIPAPSEGRDKYEYVGSRKILDGDMRAAIANSTARNTAASILKNTDPSYVRGVIDFTLGNQGTDKSYANAFVKLGTYEEQVAWLTNELTNSAMNRLLSEQKSIDENGKQTYYDLGTLRMSPKPEFKEIKPRPISPLEDAASIYATFKQNPAGLFEEFTGEKTKYNKESNIIEIYGTLRKEVEDPNNPGEMMEIEYSSKVPTAKYNMNDSTDRNKFYRTLFEQSGYGGGESKDAKALKRAYGDILTQATNIRLNKGKNKLTAEELIKKYSDEQ